MTREAALLDAALTVQRWRRQFPPSRYWRFTHHIAHQLGCAPAWNAIEDEIARRLLAETEARAAA